MVTRRKYAGPTQNDMRPVDPVLTDLSIGYKNPDFIWDLLAPVVPVDEKSGTYFIWDRDYWFRTFGESGGARRAPESPYLRLAYGATTGTFNTYETGFEKPTGDPIVAASQSPEALPQKDVSFLTNQMEMELEVDTAAELFVSGLYGTDNTLSGVSQWSDFANSDPVGDFDTAKGVVRKNTGTEPRRAIMGIETWNDLKEHPLILDKYKHTQSGIMTEALVAAALGVDEIIVGKTAKNTANEGQTFVGANVWGDNCLLIPAIDAPALETPAAAYTYVWDEVGNVPWAVQQYRDETIRGNVARILTHTDRKVTSAQSGYLFIDTSD
ncbi:hypothetical protein CMI37_12135 [Candidatus Pacearchaeota archaeon]|nr:hypothetical protein [Candidatus Pacearchaeota archaeon]